MNIKYKNKSGIYVIRCYKNGKIYIGSATCIYTRWYCHISLLKQERHDNRHLQSSFNKYGINSFVFGVVEFVDDKNNLIKKEQYWIDKLNPELNICRYAQNTLGNYHSEETKKHLSNIRKGKIPTAMFTIQKTPNARMILTPKIEKYLLAHYQTSTLAGMAADLSVSATKVSKWLAEMGISKCYLRDVKHPDSVKYFRHDVNLVTI